MSQAKLSPIQKEEENIKLVDSVVKNVGIKIFIEYFATAAWLDDSVEDDTRHLVESFASNIAEDALHLIEKTENGEMEKFSEMIFDISVNKTFVKEEFVDRLNKFTSTNLPCLENLIGETV